VEAKAVPPLMESFKETMLRYLNESKAFDCWDENSNFLNPQALSFADWVKSRDEHLRRDVARYEEEAAKEEQRYNERVEYIKVMADTFGFEVVEDKDK